MWFYYENGNGIIRFSSDPNRRADDMKVERLNWRTYTWEPTHTGLAFEVMGFQADWDFLPEDKIEEFIRKVNARSAPKSPVESDSKPPVDCGDCEWCGDLRPWLSDVSRFCSDKCEAEREAFLRMRDAERAAAATDEDQGR